VQAVNKKRGNAIDAPKAFPHFSFAHFQTEVIAKPPKTSHAKFAKYAKFCFMDDFANLADFA
jgi:hypothetical protein